MREHPIVQASQHRLASLQLQYEPLSPLLLLYHALLPSRLLTNLLDDFVHPYDDLHQEGKHVDCIQPVGDLAEAILSAFVADESNDHAVEVEEEHEQVKAELEEGLPLVRVELAEYLGRVQEVLILKDPVSRQSVLSSTSTGSLPLDCSIVGLLQRRLYVLLPIPHQQRQIQQHRDPVPVYEEQDRQECVHASLRDDVHVEAVAEVDGVDVVAFQIAVHDGEEDLQEEVDGIEEDGEEVEPSIEKGLASLWKSLFVWSWLIRRRCWRWERSCRRRARETIPCF